MRGEPAAARLPCEASASPAVSAASAASCQPKATHRVPSLSHLFSSYVQAAGLLRCTTLMVRASRFPPQGSLQPLPAPCNPLQPFALSSTRVPLTPRTGSQAAALRCGPRHRAQALLPRNGRWARLGSGQRVWVMGALGADVKRKLRTSNDRTLQLDHRACIRQYSAAQLYVVLHPFLTPPRPPDR